jgi:hypothetical protein
MPKKLKTYVVEIRGQVVTRLPIEAPTAFRAVASVELMLEAMRECREYAKNKSPDPILGKMIRFDSRVSNVTLKK